MNDYVINLPFLDENTDSGHRISKTEKIKNAGQKLNPSSESLNLGHFATIFIMQNQRLGPIVNRNQVKIYLTYSLI